MTGGPEAARRPAAAEEAARGGVALSGRLRAFEGAFDVLNAEFFEGALSRPVITVAPTPGSYGHFTPWKSWEGAGGERFCEINFGAEDVARPLPEVMATLLHEMVHQWCWQEGIRDTSRGGTYHTKNFKREAERRGLQIRHDKRIGWSVTEPGRPLLQLVATGALDAAAGELHRLGGGRADPGDGSDRKASSTRKYQCPSCRMSVRATREVRIMCMDCEEQMEVA